MSSEKQIFQMREADYPDEGRSELRSLLGTLSREIGKTEATICSVNSSLSITLYT